MESRLEIERLGASGFLSPLNGLAVQLRPTALTANAGARWPPPERYQGSIGTSWWAVSCNRSLDGGAPVETARARRGCVPAEMASEETSTIGFAPRPGTAVLPTCSIRAFSGVRSHVNLRRSASNQAGQDAP
jgi:hypothetical protein